VLSLTQVQMEDEDGLLRAVIAARAAMVQEGLDPDAAKDTIGFMSRKEPLVWDNGKKVTPVQMKKALRDAKNLMPKVEEPEVVVEAPKVTQRAIDANGGVMVEHPHDTAAVECRVTGRGLYEAAVRHTAEFYIEARDATGTRKTCGGDAFFVAIRGTTRVRARIIDNQDGTYKVDWRPPQSGTYSIAVSYFGNTLPGSPFTLTASTPLPYAPNCSVKGSALANAIARSTQSFQVSFKDKLGNTAQAVDLDVYVEPMPIAGISAGTQLAPEDGSAEEEAPAPAPAKEHDGKNHKRGHRNDEGKALDGVEEGLEEDMITDITPAPGEAESTTRNRTIRVKAVTPLVIREGEELDSTQIGYVQPGELVTVIQEKVSRGKVRAMIALQSISRLPEAVLQDGSPRRGSAPNTARGSAAGSPPTSPTGLGRQNAMGDTITSSETPSEPVGQSLESSSPQTHEEIAATVAESGIDGLAGKIGWVTLMKGGKKLVTSRVRQSAGSRRQHQQQWVRRMANDAAYHKDSGAPDNKVALELLSDPTGVGFAFGGIYPGTLHARGALFESHSVSYSIGLVGQYLLHVRLRQQAAALPGSPFHLSVLPGKAHAHSTNLPMQTVTGTVGMGSEMGCGVTISTADIMGNACIYGGAEVTGECVGSNDVTSSIVDNGDGTYYLHWNSERSGKFNVAIKIFGNHIVGSPTSIKLTSTTPDLSKTEVFGKGLTSAVAGIPSRFRLKFFDQYTNAALPGTTSKFGLALLKSGEKNKEAKVHEHTMVCVNEDAGEYEITFTANKDGVFDLHLWSEELDSRATKSERVPLPGSPFHLQVSPGAASPDMSFVDGYAKESRAVDNKHNSGKASQQDAANSTNSIIAGDTITMRPQICDELGNPAPLPDGALDVQINFPDGTKQDLNSNSLKLTIQSKGGLTTYDIRHEATHAGEHEVHLLLDGAQIKGSPVCFSVEPAAPEVKMSKVELPPEPQPLYSNQTYTLVLKTYDRFGNRMRTGGLPVAGRLQLIKQGVHDLTTLMPNNHSIEVVDNDDGSYDVRVTLIKIASTVKAFVNMDKNIPAQGGELPPVQLVFIPEDGEKPTGAPAGAAALAAPDPTGAPSFTASRPPTPPPAENQKQSISPSPAAEYQKQQLPEPTSSPGADGEEISIRGGTPEFVRPKATVAVAAETAKTSAKKTPRSPAR